MKGLSIRSEEQELQAALTERRRPVLPMNSWPGDAVYYEYLRWLDQNPEVQDWSMGRVENARRVVRLLHAVVNCVEAKLEKQQAATAGNETPSDLQHDHQMGQQEDAPSIKNRGRLWGLLRKHLFKNRDEKRSRMQNERQAARNCFQTLTHSEKIIHTARDSGLLREVIEELGFAASGWDLSSGNLSKSAVEKIRDTLSQLKSNPQLQQVLEDLGRLEKTAHDDRTSRLADFIEACTQTRKVLRDLVVPGVVMDVTGIDQSDHIDLMLSDELAFLALPQLRAVWCQRFIESQLTTWKVQGTDVEQLEVPIQAKHSQGSPVRSGPLIALLDTSGSAKSHNDSAEGSLSSAFPAPGRRSTSSSHQMQTACIGSLSSCSGTFMVVLTLTHHCSAVCRNAFWTPPGLQPISQSSATEITTSARTPYNSSQTAGTNGD
jgi:uncharacterized protein with von Willebrand factor type A (vWA) domain